MLTGCQVGAQHSLGCARDKAAPLQEPADALWRIPIDLAAGLGLRFPPNVTAPAVWPQRRREGMDSERRQAPRYPFIADAEVIETASDTKLSAKTSDVSIGGGLLLHPHPSPGTTGGEVGKLSTNPTIPSPRKKGVC